MTFVDPARMVPDLQGRDCDGVRDTQPFAEATGSFHAEGVQRPVATEHLTLSDRALELVDGPRQAEYDAPERNMQKIGRVWAALLDLDKPIPGGKVALMLAGMKMVRAAHTPSEDSIVDAVGYLEIVDRLRPSARRNGEWFDVGLAGGKK